MTKTDEDLQEEIWAEVGPDNSADLRFQWPIRVVVADKEVKNSVDDEKYVEEHEGLFVSRIQVDTWAINTG